MEKDKRLKDPREAWNVALRDLDKVAKVTQKLSQDVQAMSKRDDGKAEEFETFRLGFENVEKESRRVKEEIRDATKAFKAAKLPPPSREDRNYVEKFYSDIKEDLAKGRQEWREALARGKARDSIALVQARRDAIKKFLEDAKAKIPAQMPEDEARKTFAACKAGLEEAASAAASVGLERVAAECGPYVAESEKMLDLLLKERLAEKEEQLTQEQVAARKFADALSSYGKWVHSTVQEFKSAAAKGEKTVIKPRDVIKQSEVMKNDVLKLKVKGVPVDLEPSHQEVVRVCMEYQETMDNLLRLSLRKEHTRDPVLAVGGGGGILVEPQFTGETSPRKRDETGHPSSPRRAMATSSSKVLDNSPRKPAEASPRKALASSAKTLPPAAVVPETESESKHPYAQKIAKGIPVWTEEEIQNVVAGGFKPDFAGLTTSEVETLLRELKNAIMASPGIQKRSPFDTDRLQNMLHELFVKAITYDPNNVEVKINAVSHIINWASLRLKLDYIIYKGQAIFPIVDQAREWLEKALQSPLSPQDAQRVRDRISAIEQLRKRTVKYDDNTSGRMRLVVDQQKIVIGNLEALSEKLWEAVNRL